MLFCIPKILKNESNSQHTQVHALSMFSCFVSQRYWKMKAIHNTETYNSKSPLVVLYPKDTEKWKQFTTRICIYIIANMLFCIPKILKNESNSQRNGALAHKPCRCFVSQRYWKMKAIHNEYKELINIIKVVLYPKDTEKWKQFTTAG